MMRLMAGCGACEECEEGLMCCDTQLKRCCSLALEEAISVALDEMSEGMADPEIKAYVHFAVVMAMAGHRCEAAA